ncbi:flotillin domain-containing protein [Sulfurospirillum halorespirans]|uniref:Flotilin domain-containing membrane protein n=1 Tax=Sulfurospirillum halorespirans DSM 13726 TaxID=1193502 RepID=A0A1D7TMN1_9BACT|nr:flotillin domain-containing protein [Sulfurospirillum halorespirans]AOO66259.1 flotilin domain-containing membrane protein [Sulfurospirillum halorespirans DSM 13726]
MINDTIIMIAGAAIIALITIALIVARLYKRSSKEMAFVRTGLGGEKVVLNGGAIVLPIFHEIALVNMQTLRLEVRREQSQALITGDRMRVDVQAEFYVRVKPEISSIAQAAQALGQRTLNPDMLKELIEGKFVDALRAVAAEMEMIQLHEKRSDFVQKVQQAVAEDLLKNGLELESVSLTGLDQTGKEHFNPNNAFDAEGLLRLTQTIEERNKLRNDIERDTAVQIQQKNLQTTKEALNLQQDEEYARLEQSREIEMKKAQQEADIKIEQSNQNKKSETVKLSANQEIEQARIITERKIEEQHIEKVKTIKLAEQDKEISISNKSKEESEAKAVADEARAKAVEAEEKINTARQVAIANRNKDVEIIKANEEAEKDAVTIKVGAQAEKIAAQDRAEAIKLEAQGKADAVRIQAEADEKRFAVQAEGEKAINEANNVLSAEQVKMRIQIALMQALPAIIEQSVKPMEHIDSIKIIDVGNMSNGASNTSGGSTSIGESDFSDNMVKAAMKYQVQKPLVDKLLNDIGITDIGNLSDIVMSHKNIQEPLQPNNPS